MNPELIKELSDESQELFENIKQAMDKLITGDTGKNLEIAKRDITSIIGAAEMFGVDNLAHSLKVLLNDLIKRAEENHFDQKIIGELQTKLIQAKMTLDITDSELHSGPIITIRAEEPEDYQKNKRSFGIALFTLEDDRDWEYKHVMQELGGLNIKEIEYPTGSEQGILIASSEAYFETQIQATDQMNVLVIGDPMEDVENTFVLPRSVDPAAILAVCKLINRLNKKSS